MQRTEQTSMRRPRLARRPWPAALSVATWLALLPAADVRAEGHYSVEEADVLPSGSCLLSGWVDRGLGNPYRTGMLSPQCGLGPVELEFQFSRERDAGDRSWSTPLSTSLKWGTRLAPTLLAAVNVEFEFEDASRLEQTRIHRAAVLAAARRFPDPRQPGSGTGPAGP